VAFGEALGWLPSPFHDFTPIRSILTSTTQTERMRSPEYGT
jgi:hypothetical protein